LRLGGHTQAKNEHNREQNTRILLHFFSFSTFSVLVADWRVTPARLSHERPLALVSTIILKTCTDSEMSLSLQGFKNSAQ
jgi:hypothetical protein